MNNYCRTCKYWARREHGIGVGTCVNAETNMRLVLEKQFIMTTQDFGCVLHEIGPQPPLVTSEQERDIIIRDFIGTPFPDTIKPEVMRCS